MVKWLPSLIWVLNAKGSKSIDSTIFDRNIAKITIKLKGEAHTALNFDFSNTNLLF